MRCASLALLVASACYHHIDFAHCSDCAADGGSDADGDASDAPLDAFANCFGHTLAEGGHLKVCPSTPPVPLQLGGPTSFDTNTGCELAVQVGGAGPSVCVLVGTDVTIGGLLRATGDHPLAIVATGSILVQAPIDVGSSTAFVSKGAGGGRNCGAGAGGASAGDGAGGAGGAFGTSGVGGGSALGALAGAPNLPTGIEVFQGGCNGGDGGAPPAKGAPSPGGLGGGAIYLIARDSITLQASIFAGGAGGFGGPAEVGGGGGGTGGMIGLDAPSIVYGSGIIIATGGGGGQAGGSSTGDPGGDGISTTAAPGGTNASDVCGGVGGNGGANTAPVKGQSTSTNACGGGGGGGTVGVIYVTGTIMGGTPIFVPAHR
jgi:hypothetical protein